MGHSTLVRVAEHDIFQIIGEGHGLMVRYVNQNPYTLRTPDNQRSAMVTNYAKSRLLDFPWARRAHPVRSEFSIQSGDKSVRFRLHRARLARGAFLDSYDAQDLQPTLNGVTTGTDPDIIFLWLAERNRLIDVWAVTPLGRLEAQEGTQRAEFTKRGRKRWGWTYRLPRVEVDLRELDMLAPPPEHPDVDLGLDGHAGSTGA